MPKYVITHGSVKQANQWHGVGASVEMSEAEAKHIDPHGDKLLPAEAHAKVQEAAKLQAQAKALTEKPSTAIPAEPTKGAPEKGGR